MPAPKSSEQRIGFAVSQRIRLPLKTVWEAATEAKHLNKFFTSGSKGDITPACDPVVWNWKGGASVQLVVTECVPLKAFQFKWKGPDNDETLVRFEFKREKSQTVIRIYEAGWKSERIDAAFDHCGGWSEWLYGLKAYLIYGIDLRK
jgi:uncharacterized protein YndB with AHSA1/START domain